MTTTKIYGRGDPTNKLEVAAAIVPSHLGKAPFDRLTPPISRQSRNGDRKAL